MKPGNKDKRRCQDLCWKAHDWAQSSVFRLYTMDEFLNQNEPFKICSVRSKKLLCFVPGQGHNEGRSSDERGLVARPRFPAIVPIDRAPGTGYNTTT